eukprot:520409-Amphidinium_carterae.2
MQSGIASVLKRLTQGGLHARAQRGVHRCRLSSSPLAFASAHSLRNHTNPGCGELPTAVQSVHSLSASL